MANGGGTDGRKDGRTDGRTDVWKFPPVFYRTSALWGRCPKRIVRTVTRSIGNMEPGDVEKFLFAVLNFK